MTARKAVHSCKDNGCPAMPVHALDAPMQAPARAGARNGNWATGRPGVARAKTAKAPGCRLRAELSTVRRAPCTRAAIYGSVVV